MLYTAAFDMLRGFCLFFFGSASADSEVDADSSAGLEVHPVGHGEDARASENIVSGDSVRKTA